jgi:hypothetical protein
MFSWIVDESTSILIVLALVAGILGAVWWNTRKRWSLIGTVVTAVLMVAVIVLCFVVVTDTAQLKSNVVHIRDAVNDGNFSEALLYFDDKVKVTGMTSTRVLSKEQILAMANLTKGSYQVKQIQTGTVDVELKRPHAKLRFVVGDADDTIKRGQCIMDCEFKQGKWVVTTISVETLVGGKGMPVLLLPGS